MNDERALEAAARAVAKNYAPIKKEPGHSLWCDRNKYFFRDDATAAIRAYNAAMEAEGFVLVPVEPTDDMCKAAEDHVALRFSSSDMIAEARKAYRAMIAARPRAEGEG